MWFARPSCTSAIPETSNCGWDGGIPGFDFRSCMPRLRGCVFAKRPGPFPGVLGGSAGGAARGLRDEQPELQLRHAQVDQEMRRQDAAVNIATKVTGCGNASGRRVYKFEAFAVTRV